MKLFVKIGNAIKSIETHDLAESPKTDLIGNLWVKISGEWHPARKEGKQAELNDIKFIRKVQ